MSTLYRSVLIESAEQAEALPVGTVAAQAATERWPALACIRVDYGWHCTGETDDDGDMTLIGHDLMVGDTALVPIEAEEVRVIASGGLERDYSGVTVLNHTPDGPRRDYRRTEFHTPWEEA